MAKYPPSAPFFGMPCAPNPPPASRSHPSPSLLPRAPSQQQQAQQAQQAYNGAGFQQNASLPPVDFHALGLNPPQLAALWTQVQNGAIPPPLPFPPPFVSQPGYAPPPPPIPFAAGIQPPPTPAFPIPPPHFLPGIHAPPSQQPVANPLAPNNRVMEIVNGDKEEGELSDEAGSHEANIPAFADPGRVHPSQQVPGDEERPPSGGDFYRPGKHTAAPSGPALHHDRYDYGVRPGGGRPRSPAQRQGYRDRRSPVNSPRDYSRHENRYEDPQRAGNERSSTAQQSTYPGKQGPGHRPASALGRQPSSSKVQRDLPAEPGAPTMKKKRAEAQVFLTALHAHGFSYSDVQGVGFDPKLFKELWVSCGLPLDPPQLEADVGTRSSVTKAPSPPPNTRRTVQAGGPVNPPPGSSSRSSQNAAPPVESASAVTPTAATASAQPLPQPKPVEKPTVGIPGTNLTSAGQVTSPPVDRAAYIARLMAAKNSKASAASKTTVSISAPATVSEPAPAPSIASVTSQEPLASLVTAGQLPAKPAASTEPRPAAQEVSNIPDPAVLAAQKKEAQNELLRKKIEALRLPRKRSEAEEEGRAKAQAFAATITGTGNRTPSRSGTNATDPTQSILQQSLQGSQADIPVRPAQQETAAVTGSSTPRATDFQTYSTPSAVQAPSPGGIPGLFMTAPVPVQAPAPPQPAPVVMAPVNKARKRPVASDFDDLQHAAPPTFKRQFGQSRYENKHEEMIIEVSDDETAGSVMDIDEADDEPQPARVAVQQSSNVVRSNANAGRNLPLLTNFPARPNFSRQGSAQATPPAVQTPGSAAKLEDLKRKEDEIAALKKRLANKERERKARLQSSRAPTPATPSHATQASTPQRVLSPSATAVPTNGAVTPHTQVATPPMRSELPPGAGAAPVRISTPNERSISRAGEKSSAPQSPAESGWKMRRRAEIQSGLTAFDADLNNNMSRLEQLKREMEQIEAENRRRQREKEDLINELENLGIDTEGMPHEELQAKKDEIMQQQDAEAAAAAAAAVTSEKVPEKHSAEADVPAPASVKESARPSESSSGGQNSQVAGDERLTPSKDKDTQTSEGEIDESDTTEAEMDMSDSEAEKDESIQIQTAVSTNGTMAASALLSQDPLEPAAQSVPLEEPQSKPTYPTENSDQGEDTEDFYSPEPLHSVNVESGIDPINASQDHEPTEPGYDGLPGDDGDDYAPPESVHPESMESGPSPVEPDVPDTESRSSEAMDEGEDDYEPIDVLPEPSQHSLSRNSTSAPASEYPSPQTTSVEGIQRHSAPRSVAGSQIFVDSEPASVQSGSEAPSQTPQLSIIAGDLAPELQQPSFKEPQASQIARTPSEVTKQPYYTPYESPLSQFKAYRYHPQYSQSVSGGFRSLTYSHEIDSMKPICPYETAGGICNDSECDGQHFRAMGLSEDKILVQLGIVNIGRTTEEQERWRAGLKQVLKNLREQNVKNAESVAAAITNYRREFLQDPSRVLNL